MTLVCGVPDSYPPAQIAMFKDGEDGEVQRIESSVGYKVTDFVGTRILESISLNDKQ